MSDLQTRADRLWALLYGTWSATTRASRMSSRRDGRKYSDIAEYSFRRTHVAEHLAGTATYATTLGAAGTARASCKDYDSASEAKIQAALDQAGAQGITAAAIVMPENRAHLWVFYDRPYAESGIRAQLRTMPSASASRGGWSGRARRMDSVEQCIFHMGLHSSL